MVVEASITGLFRTLLIILGAIVLLRFIGQLMRAKRAMDEERRLNERSRKEHEEAQKTLRNYGKTHVISGRENNRDIEDVSFEEVE